MKHKLLKIGICLLIVGLIEIIYTGTAQAKININRMTAADWNDSHISEIGSETQSKLLANVSYSDIKDTAKIKGIGTIRQNQIERHFCTYDTCRFEIFLVCVVSSCVLTAIGALIIICVFVRRKCTADTLTELIKR